jgi:eukaryotic-like serine/threonine-protein kinase
MMVPPLDRSGQLLGGRYRLTSVIGKGGQSVLYRASDEKDGDEVAIKVMHALPERTLAKNPALAAEMSESQERMFREAQAMASLAGTAAVRILHQLWTDDHAMCLVMELLHGENLLDFLRAREAEGRLAGLGTMKKLLTPIVDTLEAAHARGIVHRDLKPENIFVIDDEHGGGVKLLDFGLAKFLRSVPITAAGMVAGSPSYIAPEAFLKGSSGLDHRIDVYSLGVIMFRMLAGKLPFDGPDLRTQFKLVTTGERPSLHALRPDLSPFVDRWVQQALAIDPESRFNKVSAMWNALLVAAQVEGT